MYFNETNRSHTEISFRKNEMLHLNQLGFKIKEGRFKAIFNMKRGYTIVIWKLSSIENNNHICISFNYEGKTLEEHNVVFEEVDNTIGSFLTKLEEENSKWLSLKM
jgi:hypothetical protein